MRKDINRKTKRDIKYQQTFENNSLVMEIKYILVIKLQT